MDFFGWIFLLREKGKARNQELSATAVRREEKIFRQRFAGLSGPSSRTRLARSRYMLSFHKGFEGQVSCCGGGARIFALNLKEGQQACKLSAVTVSNRCIGSCMLRSNSASLSSKPCFNIIASLAICERSAWGHMNGWDL